MPKITLDNIINELQRACVDKKHNFHYFVFATISSKNQVNQRMVVLRFFNKKDAIIYIHTDFRSPKVEQININPNVSLLFYNSRQKLQLSIKAKAIVHHKNETSKWLWSKSSANSVKGYLGKMPPSVKCDCETNNLEEKYLKNIDSLKTVKYAYENFAVIACHITSIDALLLNRTGHKRKLFELENENWVESYLVP